MSAHQKTHKRRRDAAYERGRADMRDEAKAHLMSVAQALWDRCETRRPEDAGQIGVGEKEDATTAYCFEQAAKSLDNLRSAG